MKKLMIAILLTIGILTSCGTGGGESVTEVDVGEIASGSQTEPVEPNENAQGAALVGEVLTTQGPFGSISVTVPSGWAYTKCAVNSDELLSGDYGFRIRPEGVDCGWIDIAYHSSFGVCGTGLETEHRKLAGVDAEIGYYDGSSVWNYVAFSGELEHIVATACETEEWTDELMNDIALNILDTIQFHPEEQEGAIGVYGPENEIEELALGMDVKEVSATGITLNLVQYDADIVDEIVYGEEYTLERRNGDSWEPVDIVIEGDYGFNDIGNLVTMDGETEYQIDWEWLYGSLEPGDYRIGVDFHGMTSKGADAYTAYASFIIR